MSNSYWVVALGFGAVSGVASCRFSSPIVPDVGDASIGGDGLGGGAVGQGGNDNGEAGDSSMPSNGGAGGAMMLPPGAATGEACKVETDCRAGLTCDKDKCAPGHATKAGQACVIGDECSMGLQCVARHCAPATSMGAAGDTCQSDLDCGAGFRCGIVGLGLSCVAEGSGDVGAKCITANDCYAGIGCVDGACAITPPGSPFGKPWAGVACADVEKGVPVRAYFEVPGAKDADEDDFFRLPFPNDARRSSKGVLDLSGFPTPGSAVLGFDPVQLYVDAITANDSAWGAYPTVTFRFSGSVDGGTLDQTSIHLSDVTPGLKPGQDDSGNWMSTYSPSKSAYVCDNWLAIERGHGRPLQPNHTYAFWLSTAVKAEDGSAVQRSPNFASLLADSAPTDPKLATPYANYKPFRDFIAAAGTSAPKSADEVLTASVITVGAILDPMTELAASVAAQPAPTSHDWIKCAPGITSPCPQAKDDRACGAPNAAFDEYQALVSLPIFQKGFPKGEPYLTPVDGGDIELSNSAPREDVCLGLTIPKGKVMPAAGWPVVIFAHGTGGSFRSHMNDSTAGVLSLSPTPFAVLGIDQVEHGPRRGASSESPNNLFFNFSNPKAARGNPLQGAADQLSLLRLASALDLTAAQSGGDAIKLDPANIAFFGHSQGSTEGSLAMPFADGVKAVVLSGNGASLKFALISKTNPVNIAGALPFVLQDPPLANPDALPEMHPVLSLLQQWIDPADPLNFARAITRNPQAGHDPKNVFQTYGLGDTYAPPVTLREYVIAGQLDLVTADASAATPDAIPQAKAQASGVSGNVTLATKKYTVGVREYGPPAKDDGHFVAFDVPSANADVVRFLSASVSSSEPPPIGAP
jgi:hypothetical protein